MAVEQVVEKKEQVSMNEINKNDVKKMSASEFRREGYLQELNRRFLHPLGLALEVRIHSDGSESFGEVWDCRDDPEGMTFAPGVINSANAARIADELEEKGQVRMERLGYQTQPYGH